jgi:hypothetical protein
MVSVLFSAKLGLLYADSKSLQGLQGFGNQRDSIKQLLSAGRIDAATGPSSCTPVRKNGHF